MEMYDGVITKVIHIQGKYQFFPTQGRDQVIHLTKMMMMIGLLVTIEKGQN